MAEMPVTVREATEQDLPSLRRALLAALTWRQKEEVGIELIERSGHGYLLEGWGRAGDTAVVAEVGSAVVGAAWYRSWTRDRHSYGFIEEAIPEVGMGVERTRRGRGIGTDLLLALFRLAGERGVKALSLSVEKDNPARRLYRRLGFRSRGTVGGAVTMVRTVEDARAGRAVATRRKDAPGRIRD